jgi:hypothetical protein
LYRLVLSVDMMAQSVAVEIDVTDVEPITVPNLTDSISSVQSSKTGVVPLLF